MLLLVLTYFKRKSLNILIDGHQVEHSSHDQLSAMNNLVSVHVGKFTKTIMGFPGDAL